MEAPKPSADEAARRGRIAVEPRHALSDRCYARIARARTSTLAEIEASSGPGDVEDLVAEL